MVAGLVYIGFWVENGVWEIDWCGVTLDFGLKMGVGCVEKCVKVYKKVQVTYKKGWNCARISVRNV